MPPPVRVNGEGIRRSLLTVNDERTGTLPSRAYAAPTATWRGLTRRARAATAASAGEFAFVPRRSGPVFRLKEDCCGSWSVSPLEGLSTLDWERVTRW